MGTEHPGTWDSSITRCIAMSAVDKWGEGWRLLSHESRLDAVAREVIFYLVATLRGPWSLDSTPTPTLSGEAIERLWVESVTATKDLTTSKGMVWDPSPFPPPPSADEMKKGD